MPRIEALLVVACLCHLKVYQWICSIVTAQEKKKQKEKKACDSSQPGTARTPDQKNTKAVSSPELNLEKKENQILKEALTTEISRGKRQTIRRTQKNPQEKKNIPKPKTKTSNGIGPWWQERWQKGWRRRTCEKKLLEKKNSSRAYNAARKQAAREGKSPATCKTLAWPAHAKMASYIDSGVVKENYWAEIFTCGKKQWDGTMWTFFMSAMLLDQANCHSMRFNQQMLASKTFCECGCLCHTFLLCTGA